LGNDGPLHDRSRVKPQVPTKQAVELADRFWPEERRHQFLKWLCVFGFAIGSFQAFDHVNADLKSVRAQPGYIANRWPALTSNESQSLRDEWRGLPSRKLGILCGIPSCSDLAESLYDVARGLDWPAVYATTYFQDDGIHTGIEIWSYPERISDRDRIAIAIEHATKGRLKISTHEWPGQPGLASNILGGINLVIGRFK
jgi:hypothetical protein